MGGADKTLRLLAALVLAGLLCPSAALAKDKLVVAPSISVSQEYTDNVFYDDRNNESDSITKIRPTLTLAGRSENGFTELSVGAEARRYWQNTELDAIDPFVSSRFKRDLTPRVTVFGDGEYRKQNAVDAVLNGGDEIYGARPDVETIKFGGGLSRQLTRSTSITGSGGYLDIDYDQGAANRFESFTDYNVKNAAIGLNRGLSDVEAIGLVASYQLVGLDEATSLGRTQRESRDDHIVRFVANWVKTWTPRLSSNLEGGVRYLRTDGGSVVGLFEYTDPSETALRPVDTEPDPSWSFVGEATITYRTRLSVATLNLSRETRPNNGSQGSQDVDQVSMSFRRRFGRRLTLSSYGSYQHAASAGTVTQPLPRGFFPDCARPGQQGGQEVCLVDVESALDTEYWTAGAELSWRIRERWSTFVSYGYQKSTNDRPDRGDYDANRVMFGFRWAHEAAF